MCPVERRRRAHLVARTTDAGGGSAGRGWSREDLRRAAVGGPARGSFDTGDFFYSCARRGACGCEAWKRSRLRLLPQRAADDRGGGPALLPAANQHPLLDASRIPFRSRVEHLLRTPSRALGGSALARGA